MIGKIVCKGWPLDRSMVSVSSFPAAAIYTLEIVAFDLGREHCAALQSLPALEILKLVGCFFPCPFHFQHQLKLKELAVIGTFCDLPFNIRLVLMLCNPAHLEKLTLTHFFATYSALTSLSFIKDYPRLTYLSIAIKSRSGGLFFQFLGSAPSLATLKILHWSANITPDCPLPAIFFLRSYYGYPDLLSHIVPGRPVDCVSLVLRVPTPSSENGSHTDDYAIHVNVIPTLLDISRSAVPVRKLRIEYFLPTLYRLTTIAKHLRDPHHLDLELISASSQLHAEDITTPSDPSPETYFDRDGNPLDPLDTIQGLFNWFAAGLASLPPKLETLRLSYSSGWTNPIERPEGIEQEETLCSLQCRYPSLREVEIGQRFWWREGGHWRRR